MFLKRALMTSKRWAANFSFDKLLITNRLSKKFSQLVSLWSSAIVEPVSFGRRTTIRPSLRKSLIGKRLLKCSKDRKGRALFFILCSLQVSSCRARLGSQFTICVVVFKRIMKHIPILPGSEFRAAAQVSIPC